MKKTLHQVSSLLEPHAFSGLPLEFGFTGKKNPLDQQGKEFHYLKQVHGTDLVEAGSSTSSSYEGVRKEGDALYSLKKNEILSSRTADCLPLLVTDSEASFALAIHAGWRGLAAGIIKKTLDELKARVGFSEGKLRVFLGPCIDEKAFEVGPEVTEVFRKESLGLMERDSFDTCYSKGSSDRSYFSLKQFAFLSLLAFGVKEQNISSLHSCTYHNQEEWFSYRRSERKLEGYDWSWITRQ